MRNESRATVLFALTIGCVINMINAPVTAVGHAESQGAGGQKVSSRNAVIAATTSQSTTTSQSSRDIPSQTATPTSQSSNNVKAASPAVAPDPKDIESQLRDLADTLKRVHNAANTIQLECSRVYNADAWDNVLMDPWMEGQPGLAHVQSPPFPDALKPLPARKKWIDNDLNQLTQLLKMLTTDVNTIQTAASLDTSIKVSVEIMQDNLRQVDDQYSKLVSLTSTTAVDAKGQPAYDKIGIARAAQAVKDEASGLNEIRKRMLRQMRDLKK